MACKLMERGNYEAENTLEVSLNEAFHSLEPKLRPPFSLKIPTHEEYINLNRAILYGILCEPHLAKVHIKHLHGKITDGYEYFTSFLIKIVNELYAKLVVSVRRQLLWVTHEMVNVLAVGFDGLLVSLLRQIGGGDFDEENLWLCYEVVSIFSKNWDCLLEEEPLVMTSAMYVFLRLLADHCRELSNTEIESLRQMEINFCARMFREKFSLCLRMGRDVVRLLQDLIHVPEFRAIWKDLLYNPSAFRTDEFVDISQIYGKRTSSRYFLLRITPEMESQLRFLLTHVKFGSQRRYQIWFAKKFLALPEKNTVVIDIVRFICCAHHPSNEIIQSDIIPRWAIIGWLLKSGLKNYVEANVKLALFYEWLFFDENVDTIMNVEPAILLMLSQQDSKDPKIANATPGTKAKRTRKTIPRDSPPQRSSIYRGVTRHRWTGRYEAHLWDKNCWNESQNKKGRQVYLGAYSDEDAAGHSYDLAALKYWGEDTILNFPLSTYKEELIAMEGLSREEYIGSLRRKSSGFSRGVSKYRGVARHHHNGKWEARIGRVFGNKYLYLGTYATQEEAAVAYDVAAIEYRGLNAVTNFDLSRYIKWLRPNNSNTENDVKPNLALCSNHDSASFHPLQQPDTTNIPALSPPRPTTATSALGLLLQSSKFKEMMEMNSAAECPSMEESDPPQGVFPNDVKTYFGLDDFSTYNNDQGDDIFGELNSFMQMLEPTMLNGESLML